MSTLPESVRKLSSLIKLDLAYCDQLSALPESVGHLSSLIIGVT